MTSSNKATPPNPSWEVSPTGNQVDKYRSLWRSFSFTPFCFFQRLGLLKPLVQDASSLFPKCLRVCGAHQKSSKWLAWWDSLGSGLRLDKKGCFAGCVSWTDTYLWTLNFCTKNGDQGQLLQICWSGPNKLLFIRFVTCSRYFKVLHRIRAKTNERVVEPNRD